MVSKPILNARNLEALGAAALADLLIELASGRAEQALEILDGATEEMAGSIDSQWHDCRITVREALDRQAEAQEKRWQWLSRSLVIPHLRDYLQRLDDFEVEDLAARFDNWQGRPDHTTDVERLMWSASTTASVSSGDSGNWWSGEAQGIGR